MTKFNTEETIAFRTSCNKEDAVAKLLGWLQGPVCQDLTEPEYGFSLQQLKYMGTLIYSLPEHLTDLRNQALWKTDDLIAEKASEEEVDKAINEVLDIEDLMKRANLFMIEIEDELSKGDASLLRVDPITTEDQDEIHITIKSFDTWARKTFDIAILDKTSIHYSIPDLIPDPISEPISEPIPESIPESIPDPIPESIPDPIPEPLPEPIPDLSTIVPRQRAQEILILETIRKNDIDPLKLPKFIKGIPGIKSLVRKTVSKNPLFSRPTTFKKAWERLSDFEDIKYLP